MTAETGGK